MGADLAELLSAFTEDTQRQLQQLDDLLEAGDADGLRKAAHSLKGAAASVGAPALSAQFLRLEQCAGQGQWSRAAVELSAARGLFAESMERLQRWQPRANHQ